MAERKVYYCPDCDMKFLNIRAYENHKKKFCIKKTGKDFQIYSKSVRQIFFLKIGRFLDFQNLFNCKYSTWLTSF